MKKEVAEAWVKDLRTNPPQCSANLYNGSGYCCLGRLALVLGAEFEHERFDDGIIPHRFGGEVYDQDEILTPVLMEASGMKTPDGQRAGGLPLTEINDCGSSFAEIADIIEKEWAGL